MALWQIHSYCMSRRLGRGGLDMMNALDDVDSPAGHAVLMVGAGLIGAWVCFYRAHLVEDSERSSGEV